MLENKVYSFSELRSILAEAENKKPKKAKNEFKKKVGKGYSDEKEKSQNRKAVKDIADETSKYDGGLGENNKHNTPPQDVANDLNAKTTDFVNLAELPDDTTERMESQFNGFSSKEHEEWSRKNNEFHDDFSGNADFSGNKEIYKKFKNDNDARLGNRKKDTTKGLTARERPESDFDQKNKTAYTNESRKMKRLHFKNTTFLNESQMLSKIPDDYKFDGNRFIMKDSKGNEYLVECKSDALCRNYVHVNVVDHNCGKKTINEMLEKFYHLSDYSSSDHNTKANKASEAENYGQLLENTRRLAESGKKKQIL